MGGMSDAFWTVLCLMVTNIVCTWIKHRYDKTRLKESLDKQTEDIDQRIEEKTVDIKEKVEEKGNETNKGVYELSNGGPNGFKEQVRSVIKDLIEPTRLADAEKLCPFMKAIGGGNPSEEHLSQIAEISQANQILIKQAEEREARHAQANRENLLVLNKRIEELTAKFDAKVVPSTSIQEKAP